MDEEEMDKEYEEYKKKIKEKTDRELMESIALRLKSVELMSRNADDSLVDTYNLVLDLISLIEDKNSSDELDEEFEEDEEIEDDNFKEDLENLKNKVQKLERDKKEIEKKKSSEIYADKQRW